MFVYFLMSSYVHVSRLPSHSHARLPLSLCFSLSAMFPLWDITSKGDKEREKESNRGGMRGVSNE